MSRKGKGIKAERELIHLFWKQGWAAIRVAGSGSSRYPSPDVLAGNGVKCLAIECKSSSEKRRYLTNDEVKNLLSFSKTFGAEPWIGIRFNTMPWYFLPVSELKKTGKHFAVDIEQAKQRGLLFDELMSF